LTPSSESFAHETKQPLDGHAFQNQKGKHHQGKIIRQDHPARSSPALLQAPMLVKLFAL
jgi:hypothetical protein